MEDETARESRHRRLDEAIRNHLGDDEVCMVIGGRMRLVTNGNETTIREQELVQVVAILSAVYAMCQHHEIRMDLLAHLETMKWPGFHGVGHA